MAMAMAGKKEMNGGVGANKGTKAVVVVFVVVL
jgi:hypothetical protein